MVIILLVYKNKKIFLILEITELAKEEKLNTPVNRADLDLCHCLLNHISFSALGISLVLKSHEI